MAAIPSDSAGESTGESTGESSRRSCSRGSNSMSQSPRTCILGVGASAGRLCGVALNLAPDSVYTNTNSNTNSNANTNTNSKSRPLSASNADQLTDALNDLMVNLCATASSLNLDWVRSIRAKMALNEKKYPVEHCKGKAGKYTKYSHLTGVTTTNQSTQDFVDWNDGNNNKNKNENENDNKNENRNSSIHPSVVSLHDFAEDHLVELSEFIAVFATERLWAKYHTPRNLVLALLGEAGELAELLQWNGDHDHDHEHDHEQDLQQQQQQQHAELDAELDAETLDKLSQELADVSIYAIRLATVCGVVEDLRESLKTPPGASNTNSTAL